MFRFYKLGAFMILSATFDEQILKCLSIDEWLEFCVQQKIKSLEFSPEPSVLSFDVYKSLINRQGKKVLEQLFMFLISLNIMTLKALLMIFLTTVLTIIIFNISTIFF